jgi:SSS family transporter
MILAGCVCAGSIPLQAGESATQRNSLVFMTKGAVELPSLRPGQAVGPLGKGLVIAGGLAPDGSAVRQVHFLGDGETDWQETGLESPLAHAVTAYDHQSFFLVGGWDGHKTLTQVLRLYLTGGEVKSERLPSLPSPRVLAGAAVLEGTLYVTCGMEHLHDHHAHNSLWALDLSAASASWRELEPLPGAGRVRPAVIGMFSDLHVLGGERLAPEGGGVIQAIPTDEGWGYRARPIDGMRQQGWHRLRDLPQPLAGSAILQTGQAHLALAGGFTRVSPFSLVPLSYDNLSDRIYLYHNVTDTWVEGGRCDSGVAGATGLNKGAELLIANGWREGGEASAGTWTLEVHKTVRRLDKIDYTVMALYFLAMAAIGLYFARRQKTSDEFSLGNRNVKWWAASLSMFATGASSISYMAIPAQTFRSNLVWFIPVLTMIPLAVLQAYAIYPLLRRMRLTSTYEFLEHRYNGALRLLASFQCIAFQTLGRMSVVLLLPSIAISAVTGVDVVTCVIVMGLLTTVYTTFGGFDAVIWTDVTQGILMLAGGFLMIGFGLAALPGGVTEFLQVNAAHRKFDAVIWDWSFTMPIIWIFLIQQLMTALAIAQDQPVVQRVLATPLRDVRKLAFLYAVWGVLIAVLVNAAALVIFAYFHAFPEKMDPGMTTDQIVPLYIVQGLPSGLSGILVAAIFAASMSTLSSSMNSVATLVSEDFYRRFFPASTDHARLRLMKLASLCVGLFGTGIAVWMARMNIRSMFQVWNEICALIGGGFVGIYILGMFTRRTNSSGAIIGALTSVIVTILVRKYTALHWVFYSPVAVLTCLGVGYAASLAGPAQKKNLRGLTVFTMLGAITDDEILAARERDTAPVASAGEQGD